ncbi:hypothetical protein BDP27DRAFT_1368203 [Rhodocollybia butyracea]|uniref:Uncharacterized protein n=1 Tax=Rhodocollybia butyracea TaxID=206335 RepID=A0A9P5PIF3_9AGAR|nr:hypothetical protein BDP27DRAFT_1368203 [Rhodocollybia butyracea]
MCLSRLDSHTLTHELLDFPYSIISNLQLPTWLVTPTVRPDKPTGLKQTLSSSRYSYHPSSARPAQCKRGNSWPRHLFGYKEHTAFNTPLPATRLAPTPALATVEGHIYNTPSQVVSCGILKRWSSMSYVVEMDAPIRVPSMFYTAYHLRIPAHLCLLICGSYCIPKFEACSQYAFGDGVARLPVCEALDGVSAVANFGEGF